MKIDLSGRIALVTGGSGELGREMVRTLAECGAAVVIHYHRQQGSGREGAEGDPGKRCKMHNRPGGCDGSCLRAGNEEDC